MADPHGIRTRAEWTQGLQTLFDRAGLSYHVLGGRCGISASTLQKMVTGQSFPRPSTVRLFVQACGERDTQPWVDARNRIAKIDVTLKRPRTPPGRQVRIGAVPRAADSFQDRKVAAGLREAAEQDGTVVLTQTLAGMGGVGKTQLAAAHARQAWRDGVGLLVWVNAASRDAIVAAYADAALALVLTGADREDPERSAQVFLAWAETTGQWWLVVLDGVQRPGDLNGLWPPAAESAAAGQVLVTTRLREAALAGSGRRTVEVSTFTAQEARAYLQANLGGRALPEPADVLAGALGMLPLALAQAAAYIRNADITIGRYLDLLATRLLRDVVPEPCHLTDDHQRIITATWELSIDQANRARPAGLARPLLQLASVLDPSGIPQAVLASPAALDYLTTYMLDPAADTVDAERADAGLVDEALRVLHRHSLIDHDRTATHRQVRVHQLVQRATRENLATQPGHGPDLFAALAGTAADALLAVWPRAELDELGQVLRANTAALEQAAAAALWDTDCGNHMVLFRAATSLAEAGQVNAAVAAYTSLRSAALRHLGPDHLDTFTTRYNLASFQVQTGDAASAVAANEELLADVVRVLGPDHSLALATRLNLAAARGAAGDPTRAIAAFEELLTDVLRVLGPDDPLTLAVRSNLARWRIVAGDPVGATDVAKSLLADDLRVLGAGHPDTLTTRNNLAVALGEAGDPTGAVAAFEELLTDTLRVRGPDHPETLTTRSNLAHWRGKAGDTAGSAVAYEELLADFLRVLGPDHPDTLVVHSSLAGALGAAGDAARAAAAYEELLADDLRVLGPEHPGTLSDRNSLAGWRGEAGDAVAAVGALEELLADYLRLLGTNHPDTLSARSNLAHWRGKAGDATGAAAAYEELLADLVRVLGSGNPAIHDARSNLAYWRGRAGDVAGAAAAVEELLADWRRLLGPDHPDTLATRGNLADLRGEAGDAAGAVAALEGIIHDLVRVLGPDHPDTLAARNNLAYWQDRAGDTASAVAAYEELLVDNLRVLGPDHPSTLDVRSNLAYLRERAGME